jgi:CBS domain-containing protein
MLVRELMTRAVVTVGPDAPVPVAARMLTGRGFTALPVVDADGELVGIVTEADLLRDRVQHDGRSPLLGAELATAPASRVGEVMTTDVLTVSPFTDVADLVQRMQALGVRSVPVVEPGAGVVGVISRRDVLGAFSRTDAAIATDVRHELECYAGPRRWDVSVDGGRVTLRDAMADPAEEHPASVVAAAVHGVVQVRVLPACD